MIRIYGYIGNFTVLSTIDSKQFCKTLDIAIS